MGWIFDFAKKALRRIIPSSKGHNGVFHPDNPQVLFINGCDVPHPVRYRVLHQMEQLESVGITTNLVYYTDLKPEDADRAEVFLVYRCPMLDRNRAFFDRAHELGKKIYFDVDDLVIDVSYTGNLDLMNHLSVEERTLFEDGVMRTGQTLKLCDAGITTTGALAEEMRKYVPTVFINRNVASQEIVHSSQLALAEKKHNENEVVLGYFSGSLTHNKDFELIVPALSYILKKYPHAVLAVVGEIKLPPQLEPYNAQVRASEFVDYRVLPMTIARADINLAPIEPTLFNAAKSENKWLEASLVKVATVASGYGAFAEVIINDETGFLCKTQEDWISALSLLIENKQLRDSLAENAYRHCMRFNVTRKTGFPLAHLLTGLPTSLKNMIPKDLEVREELVSDWLEDRGMLCEGEAKEYFAENRADVSPWDAQSLRSRLKVLKHGNADEGKKTAVFLYERTAGDTATFRYFGYNTMQVCREVATWAVSWLYVDELPELEALNIVVDVAVLIRMRLRPEVDEWVRSAKAAGAKVAYLVDDDVLRPESAKDVIRAMATDPESTFERSFWKGCCARFRACAQLSDSIIVTLPSSVPPTEESLQKPVFTIHNSLNDEQLGVSEKAMSRAANLKKSEHDFAVAYFSGTSSHDEDFRIVQDVLADFLEEHDNSILLLCGELALSQRLYELWLSHKVRLLPLVDYAVLQYLQASVDVVLAPLVVDGFSNFKSGLKVFEAGAAGTPAIASKTEGYCEAVTSDSGWLCDTQEEWAAALEEAFAHPDKTAEKGRVASVRARNHYAGAALREETEQALSKIIEAQSTPLPKENGIMEIAKSQNIDWNDPFAVNPLFAEEGEK